MRGHPLQEVAQDYEIVCMVSGFIYGWKRNRECSGKWHSIARKSFKHRPEEEKLCKPVSYTHLILKSLIQIIQPKIMIM